MSNKKQNRKTRSPTPRFLNGGLTEGPGSHFTQVYDVMLFSTPYKELSPAASRILQYMYVRYRGNQDTFRYTYDELMRDTGIGSRATISRCIHELVDHGFIEIVLPGGKNSSTLYRYSERWIDQIPSEEWHRIQRGSYHIHTLADELLLNK